MSQTEQQCIAIDRQVMEITEQIDALENNGTCDIMKCTSSWWCLFFVFSIVKEAMVLNKKLQYINSHQKCLINEYKENLSKCYKELTEAKVEYSCDSNTIHFIT